jgi:hypothetical protein
MGALSSQRIPLVPHGNEITSDFKITVLVKRQKALISLDFEVSGNISDILFPELTTSHQRKDSLWEQTCFEAFISWKNQKFYWELNLSPSGDWNFYYFDDYRSGQREERKIDRVFYQREDTQHKNFLVTLDLTPILPQKTELSLGLAAVIEKRDHSKSYWTLRHLSSKPDFHIRQSFIFKI